MDQPASSRSALKINVVLVRHAMCFIQHPFDFLRDRIELHFCKSVDLEAPVLFVYVIRVNWQRAVLLPDGVVLCVAAAPIVLRRFIA